jgi:hypothetical protein
MVYTFWKYTKLVCELAFVTILFSCFKLIVLFAPETLLQRVAKLAHKLNKYDPNGEISPVEALQSAATFVAWRRIVTLLINAVKDDPVGPGDSIYDVTLLKLNSDGMSNCRLLDFLKPGRPLVVNFGSCT